MQPELSGPNRIERAPQIETGASPELYLPQTNNPEVRPINNERMERQIAGSAIENTPMMPPPMPTIPVPAPVPTQVVQVAEDGPAGYPISANDDDNIEREWVDRAKQIILQTKDDPRAREKAIGALQRDYLEKRYGKKLGATSD